MTQEKKLSIEDMATFCKKKGFIFQAAEIYGGLSGFFDFGPLGVELKNNLKSLYWKKFVQKKEDIFGQDGSIITNPKVWKASGHLDTFGDLLLTTKDSKTKLRADHFIEDELNILADGMSSEDIMNLIKKHDLKYNGEEFLDIKMFRGMFETQVGADASKDTTAYLRPETAQSIFPNFRIIADTSRAKLPFGIAQIGKAFRNEISPRDFIFRCREFEQMELEYFYNSDSECKEFSEKHKNTKIQFLSAQTQDSESEEMQETTIGALVEEEKINSYHGFLMGEFFNWFINEIGLSYENLRIREHVKTELSHYSSATLDIDYKYPFGFKEMLGMANRGSFDLAAHQKASKTKLELYDEATSSKVLASVIEPSFGIERLMFATLYESYNDNKERGNISLNLPINQAPYKVAIFPLMNKEELISVAREIFDELRDEDIVSFYDKSGSIGKRYARQDEIGTPYTITVDYEYLENGENKGTITIRDRNSTRQVRVARNKISNIIGNLIKGKITFESL